MPAKGSSTECSGRLGFADRPTRTAQPPVEIMKISGGGADVVVAPHAGPASVRNQFCQLRRPGQAFGIGAEFTVGGALPGDRRIAKTSNDRIGCSALLDRQRGLPIRKVGAGEIMESEGKLIVAGLRTKRWRQQTGLPRQLRIGPQRNRTGGKL